MWLEEVELSIVVKLLIDVDIGQTSDVIELNECYLITYLSKYLKQQ